MLDYDEALQTFAHAVYSVIGGRALHGRFIRDVFGRLSFIETPGALYFGRGRNAH